MLFASIIIILVFFGYLYFVGIPLTNSNNHLNQGIRNYEAGEYDKAKVALEKSLKIWYSEAAAGYLQQTQEMLKSDAPGN